MLEAFLRWQRGRVDWPYVRPWGLSAPILVLVVCLPLLRPLRYAEVSDNEAARLATIEAIVEHGTLAIDETSFATTGDRIVVKNRDGEPRGTTHYSRHGPVLSVLLAGPYWVLHRFGLTFHDNTALVAYVLTLVGVTLPVAGVAGLIYRMGRLFELSRPWRMLLSVAAVFGSGLISYATVLNSHAPAAALVLAASASLLHAATSKKGRATHAWVVLAGLCAGTAAVIDFGAFAFLVLLVLVIPAMRWGGAAKIGAVACYLLGAAPALALHAALTVPVTGDFWPGFLHPELAVAGGAAEAVASDDPFGEDVKPSWSEVMAMHVADGLLGPRGLLSHFPVLLFGVGGMGAVLHRHWPATTKTLAVVTFVGGGVVVATYLLLDPDWRQPMFSVRWFVLFMPLVVFWAGAWLRRRHHPVMWAGAALLLLFSIGVGLLGAAAPFPAAREGEYTVYAAARQLFSGSANPPAQIVAGAR